MNGWYDKACEELDTALERGDLTYDQHKAEMRLLNEDLRSEAEEAAHHAYDDVMGQY